jgi:hypothetical protein
VRGEKGLVIGGFGGEPLYRRSEVHVGRWTIANLTTRCAHKRLPYGWRNLRVFQNLGR